MIRIAALAIGLAIAVAACNETKVPPATANAWTIAYSPGMPATMRDNKDGTFSFDFPNKDGIHYVYKAAPKIGQGKVIHITFMIEGTGTIVPTEGAPPARIRLFVQRAGDNLSGKGEYEHYRWWSIVAPELKIGAFEFAVPLTPTEWTSVYGKRGDAAPGQFTSALNQAANIGFTFGGVFAGHGDYVKDGTAKFTLKSYAIK